MAINRSVTLFNMTWVDDIKPKKEPVNTPRKDVTHERDLDRLENLEVAQAFHIELKDMGDYESKLSYIREWAKDVAKGDPNYNYLDVIRHERAYLGRNDSVNDLWVCLKIKEDINLLTAKLDKMRGKDYG